MPFEPRHLTMALAGVNVTLLEAAAAFVILLAAFENRARLVSILRAPPLPLVAIAAYAGAHLLSAAFTPYHPGLAFRFALRMVAMAAFALIVAAAPEDARRRSLAALAVAALVVAGLAIAEGTGMRGLDPFLALFRETPFNVAGARRASAGSEYPNLAAAFLMYGLLAGVGLLSRGPRRLAAAFALVVPCACALAFTYSRGAGAATLLGLLALAARETRRAPGRALVPLASAAAVVVTAAAFVAGGEIFRLRLGSEGTTRWYSARYEPADRSLHLRPSERRRTTVRVTNTGRKTWSQREAFHLSYHWLQSGSGAVIEGPRTRLPQEVRPGDTALADAEVWAPERPGFYILAWDLVQEDTTWFSGQGVSPAVVPVVVGRAADHAVTPPPEVPLELSGPLVWQPGRSELWRLALQLWRERPLLGVGPDNYRRLYGPRAQHAFWDMRVYANSLLLEAAATTGLVGAAALAATLLATLWAAAVSDRRESGAVLAVAVGIAAHGLVDYMLAMTGHYLVFGLIVGAAAGATRDETS